MSLKIVFAGTPDFAARHLTALLASPHQIVGVYSQPDRPAGRGKKLTASPVKQLAVQHHLPVFQPASLRDPQAQAELAALGADVMVVVAYGLLLPKAVLDIPRLGCLNVHGSLLPRWRGAAPIQRSLWAGDRETGVTIMQMDEGLDTGAMLLKASCPIEAADTSASLYEKLAELGPPALLETLEQLQRGEVSEEKQDESQACYAAKLSKQEARLDWQQPAEVLERCVRAFNPWPVAYAEIAGQQVKIWQAEVVALTEPASPGTIIRADSEGILIATGQQGLNLQVLQLPGKKATSARDLLNARRDWFTIGSQLP